MAEPCGCRTHLPSFPASSTGYEAHVAHGPCCDAPPESVLSRPAAHLGASSLPLTDGSATPRVSRHYPIPSALPPTPSPRPSPRRPSAHDGRAAQWSGTRRCTLLVRSSWGRASYCMLAPTTAELCLDVVPSFSLESLLCPMCGAAACDEGVWEYIPQPRQERLFSHNRSIAAVSQPFFFSCFFVDFCCLWLCRGYTSEQCAQFVDCPDRRIWMIVAAALSLLILFFLAALLLLLPSGSAVTTANRSVSLLLLALWSAGVGVANSPTTGVQSTSTLWGAVLALAAAGVLAWDAWALVLS